MTAPKAPRQSVVYVLSALLILGGAGCVYCPELLTEVLKIRGRYNFGLDSGLAEYFVSPLFVPGVAVLLLGSLLLCRLLALNSVQPLGWSALPRSPIAPRWTIKSALLLMLFLNLLALATLLLSGSSRAEFLSWALVIFSGLIVLGSAERGQLFAALRRIRLHDLALVLLFLAAGLLLYSKDLTDERYAIRGIENAFFLCATRVLDPTASAFACPAVDSLFGTGVFGQHPALVSYYQALFMKTFGPGLWSWRFSTVFISLSAVVPLYFALSLLFSRASAVIGLTIYVSSYYNFQFSHLGYNNIHHMPLFIWAFFFLLLAVKLRSCTSAYLGAVAAGAANYFNYMAIPLPFLLGALLLLITFYLSREHGARRDLAPLGVVYLGACVVSVLPFLLHVEEHGMIYYHLVGWEGQDAAGTVISSADEAGALHALTGNLSHRIWNFFLAAFYYLVRDPTLLYYMDGFLFEPMSGLMATLGLVACACFVRHRSGWICSFLLLFFVSYSFGMGFLGRYPAPPVTRLIFLIPLVPIFAAVAAELFLRKLPLSWKNSAAIAFTAACAGSSWYQNITYELGAARPVDYVQHIVRQLKSGKRNVLFIAVPGSVDGANASMANVLYPGRVDAVPGDLFSWSQLNETVDDDTYDSIYVAQAAAPPDVLKDLRVWWSSPRVIEVVEVRCGEPPLLVLK